MSLWSKIKAGMAKYGNQLHLVQRLLSSEREAKKLRILHKRQEHQFAQFVEILTQLAMHEVHVTDNQRAFIAHALSCHKDWQQALQEIASLNPVISGSKRSPIQNLKWMISDHVDIPDQIKTLLSDTKFTIVDVGAQLLDSEDHVYSKLTEKFPCRVIGFEPLREELAKRTRKERDVEMLPYFIGDGNEWNFYETSFSPASSNFEPDIKLLGQYHALGGMLNVANVSKVQTQRMDDIDYLDDMDFLKVDIQGGELACLQGGRNVLKNVAVVNVEVEFVRLYKDQPEHHKIEAFLSENGFFLMDYRDFGYLTYKEHPVGYGGGRIGWADAVYVKDESRLKALGPQKVLKTAIIAHYIYSHWDLAAHLFGIYDEMTGRSILSLYQNLLNKQVFFNA